MATIDLSAKPRTVLGKKVKRLRREGIVPGNIYGHAIASTALEAPAKELKRVVRAAGHTGLVLITLDGEAVARTVVIRKIQRESMTGELVHVDFQQVSMTEKMNVRIPIALVGEAPAIEVEGSVVQVLDYVDVECLPGNIPSQIELNLAGLTTVDSQLHIRDLVIPAGVTVLTDESLLVVSVGGAAGEPEAEEGAAAAEETPAAGG